MVFSTFSREFENIIRFLLCSLEQKERERERKEKMDVGGGGGAWGEGLAKQATFERCVNQCFS